ncbi:hypothetical protein [Vibrio paucivorans]
MKFPSTILLRRLLFAGGALSLVVGCTTPTPTSDETISEPVAANVVVIENEAFDWQVATTGLSAQDVFTTYNTNAELLAPRIKVDRQQVIEKSVQEYHSQLSAEQADDLQRWLASAPPRPGSLEAIMDIHTPSDYAYAYDQIGARFNVYLYDYPDHFMNLMIVAIENPKAQEEVFRMVLEIDPQQYLEHYQQESDIIESLYYTECLWLNALSPDSNFDDIRQLVVESSETLKKRQPYEMELNGVRVTKTHTSRGKVVYSIDAIPLQESQE